MPKAKAKKGTVKKTTTVVQPEFKLSTPFALRVVSRDWEGMDKLNADLKQEIWRKRALDPDGLYRSNMSGTWHSDDAILTTTGKAGEHLKQMFAAGFSEWGRLHGLEADSGVTIGMAAWAMVYSDRGYAAVHTHPNCHVSGCYYVDDTTEPKEQTLATGVPVRSGDFEFTPPFVREYQLPFMKMNESMIIPFKTGRMLIFPSQLGHYVHPINGPGERISVACNATFFPPKESK